MIPATFDYVRPASLADATRILVEHDGEAVLMSGGQSLVPMLKLRLAQPAIIVDLGGIEGLETIEVSDAEVRIGGRATHRSVADHEGLRSGYPMLAELAAGIGDTQVRDWGTIGGSCAHNDPAADWPAGLIAARATIICQGAGGERMIAARELGLGAYATVLEPGDIITQIRLPRLPPQGGAAYAKVPRASGDFAVAGAAVVLGLDDSGRIETAGLGLTAVSEMAFAATDAEELLTGQLPDEAAFERAAAAAAEQSQPHASIHGSESYFRAVGHEVTLRALRAAGARAAATLDDDGESR